MFGGLGSQNQGLLGISQQDYFNQLAMAQQAAQQSPYWAAQNSLMAMQNAAVVSHNPDERLLVLLTDE